MKKIGIFQRNGRIYIQAYGETTIYQVSILDGPVFESSLDDPQLGSYLLKALDLGGRTIEHPKRNEWRAVEKPLLTAAKVRSWNQLEVGLIKVRLEENAGQCEVTNISVDPPKVVVCKTSAMELTNALKVLLEI